MSELKVYKMIDKDYCDDSFCIVPSDVYIKSEVDEVICHQKYKRCLVMAEQCKESLRLMRVYEATDDYWNLEPEHDAEYFRKKGDFYSTWRHRWLNIAEQFKEAK